MKGFRKLTSIFVIAITLITLVPPPITARAAPIVEMPPLSEFSDPDGVYVKEIYGQFNEQTPLYNYWSSQLDGDGIRKPTAEDNGHVRCASYSDPIYYDAVGDTTGDWVVPFDGTYVIDMYGGNASRAGVGCRDNLAGGGHGGFIRLEVSLKQGDTLSYTVGNGGVKYVMSRVRPDTNPHDNTFSYPYDGKEGSGHVAIGCKGRDTSLSINGNLVATAGGGYPGAAICMDSYDDCWQEAYTLAQYTAYQAWGIKVTDGLDIAPLSDDPSYCGVGGKTWTNIGSYGRVVDEKQGAYGIEFGSAQTVEIPKEGLAYQATYRNWFNSSVDQQPGMILITYEHEHELVKLDGTCTEPGTIDWRCKLCGGIKHSTEECAPKGHNWVDIPKGTSGYECTNGSTYLASTALFETNKLTWDTTPNYYYTKQCQRCGQVAEPQQGYGYVAYDAAGGTGSIATQSFLWDTDYALATSSPPNFAHDGYRAIGWRDDRQSYSTTSSAVSGVQYKLNQQVRNFVTPGVTRTLYAVWKPMWTLSYSKDIISLPVNGIANSDRPSNALVGDIPSTARRWYECYDSYSQARSYINSNGNLPIVSITGWTFKGWTIDGSVVTDATQWAWDANKTTKPQFQENVYNVTYHDVDPVSKKATSSTKVTTGYYYERTYSVASASSVGFSHNGYYLDGWALEANRSSPTFKLSLPDWIDSSRKTTDTFKKLNPNNNGNVDLYAVWKPIPLTVRIWDNYQVAVSKIQPTQAAYNSGSTSIPESPYLELTGNCVDAFRLPSEAEYLSQAKVSHSKSKLLGYVTQSTHDVHGRLDYVTVDKLPTATITFSINTAGLTSRPIVNVFCVWDEAPSITCKELPKITRDMALAAGYDVSDNAISMSELEQLILNTAIISTYDREYEARYGSSRVPIGNNHGYSVRVAAIEPKSMHNGIEQSYIADYVVTLMITDDVGQQATATVDLYFGQEMSILKDTR